MSVQELGLVDHLRPAAAYEPVARPNPAQARIIELDGLRGLMTILVVLSHFFSEVPHGWPILMSGWIAVTMFFVLSGYLVGNLIFEKMEHRCFFSTFYIRRFCRTLPIYVVSVVLIEGLIRLFAAHDWIDADHAFPLWSYLTFAQNFLMIATDTNGAPWLAPTWTLALEEHFYILAPALLVMAPRRHLAKILLLIAAASVALRAVLFFAMPAWAMTGFVLLPFRADVLVAGLLLALLFRTRGIDWTRYDLPARLAPIVLLILAALLRIVDGKAGTAFTVFGPSLVALACAAFIFTLVRGAPEAARFRSPVLRFFGRTSYAVYLTHLAVLGLMHGALLGAHPDVATPAQIVVTVLALPMVVLVGWLLTILVEEPITTYGRSWSWGESRTTSPVEADFSADDL